MLQGTLCLTVAAVMFLQAKTLKCIKCNENWQIYTNQAYSPYVDLIWCLNNMTHQIAPSLTAIVVYIQLEV